MHMREADLLVWERDRKEGYRLLPIAPTESKGPTTRALLRAACRLLPKDTGRHATLRLTSEGISRNCMYSTIKRSFSWKWKSTPSTCREASL